MIVWESTSPHRREYESGFSRRVNNLVLSVLNSVLTRLLIPVTAVGIAIRCETAGIGFFNAIGLAAWFEVMAAVVLLDFAIWCQHRLFHVVPWLWRLHRVHHADLHVDWTTGVRFHPAEFFISLGIKSGVVLPIGASPIAVIVFEVLLNATSMFNHANVQLPPALDHPLRWVLVTPSLHRIHHSTEIAEQRCNYGFNLTLWDRVFRCLRTPEARGAVPLVQGVAELRSAADTEPLLKLLQMPLRGL